MAPRDLRPELAEAVGTFLLVFVGGLAIVAGSASFAVAAAFGGVVLVLVYALGHVSGAHFNPAITLGFATTRHFPWRRVPTYLAAQLAGAILASVALGAIGPLGPVVAHGRLDGPAAGLVEAALTFQLAFVILAVATDARAAPAASGLAIGVSVAIGALAGGALTGAAMNPARALAPALLAADSAGLAATVLGPLVGGVLGMLAYEGLRAGKRPRGPPGEALGAEGPIDLEARP